MQKGSFEEKCKKVFDPGFRKYVFIRYPIFRVIPILLLLLLVNDIIFKSDMFQSGYFLLNVMLKLSLGYMLGILIGFLDWQFRQGVIKKHFDKLIAVKLRYILINGLLYIGCTFTIYDFNIQLSINAGSDTLILLALTPLIGIPFAMGAWIIFKLEVQEYVSGS